MKKTNYIQQTEEKKHFKLYKAGKHWLIMGIGIAILGTSFLTVATPKVAASATDALTSTTSESSSDTNSYQASDISVPIDAQTDATSAELLEAPAATDQVETSSTAAVTTSQISTNFSAASATSNASNVTASSEATSAVSASSTVDLSVSSVASDANTVITSQGDAVATSTSMQSNSTNAATSSSADTTAIASAHSADIHNEESSQFIAGDRSNTDTAERVPAVGSINSYINTSVQNQIDIPTGLSEDIQEQWLENAKAQATLDYQTTGREQLITMNDASVDSWTIGDSSRPSVDAVDISSCQGGMTQANFNTLKQLGVKTVIVKLTENTNYMNPYASSQINMARAAGLNVEVYHYATFSTASAAIAEANYLADVMGSLSLSGDTLVFADMEDASTYAADVAGNLTQFWNTLSSRGYTDHGVYTYVSYAYRDAVVSTVGASRTWMAQYPYSPSAGNLWNTEYGAWQFSSTAYLPGYSGCLDVSIDYSNLLVTNENKGNIDHIYVDGTTLHIDGWHAADDVSNKPYNTVILYDTRNNVQLGRYEVSAISRPDVAAAYGEIDNAANSGFSIDIPITFTLSNRDISVVLRYSDESMGNGDSLDYWSDTYNFNDSMGHIDNINFSGQTLHIDGWSAADDTYGKSYKTIILFDTSNNVQLGRYVISTVQRSDVAAAYTTIYNSLNSGFSVDIPVTFSLDDRDISVVVRYSDEEDGNGNVSDYWSDTYNFSTNTGHIEDFTISNNALHLKGWHVSDGSYGKQYATIILFDTKNNVQLGRYTYTPIASTDVQAAYSSVYNSLYSGFDIDIPITFSLNDRDISVVVRYSDEENGNGNVSDYWSDTYNFDVNAGEVEEFKVNGNVLHLEGWHVSDASYSEPYTTIILFDTKNNVQLGRYMYTPTTRTNIQSKYSDVYNSLYSGFDIDIPITFSLDNRDISVVARYSDAEDGNGNVSDYWSSTYNFNDNVGEIESLTISDNVMHIDGWYASDASYGKKYTTIILFDTKNNVQLGRYTYTPTTRNDIQTKYLNVYNSLNSGFSVDIPVTFSLTDRDISVVVRYSDEEDGNGNVSDYWSNSYTFNENVGNLEEFEVNDGEISIKGWNANDATVTEPTSYIFIMDADTGEELYRTKVTRTDRPDVAAAYPQIANSEQSGFDLTVPITNQFSGHNIKIMSRYIDDPDALATDYWYDEVLKVPQLNA